MYGAVSAERKIPMTLSILLTGSVILLSLVIRKVLKKTPLPSLLIFILLGMLFGENGIFHIPFDDYQLVDRICSSALVIIMFYGGFGTSLKAARPVLKASVLLSTAGVALSALFLAVLAHKVLGLPYLECLLIGSVISSTDAASVFSILRTSHLSLKYHTDSLLEMESGSNDPMAFMLTSVTVSLLLGSPVSVPLLMAEQIIIGSVIGLLSGYLAIKILHKNLLSGSEARTLFLLSVMLLSYAVPLALGGNGYLSTYLCGIYIGNAPMLQKRHLVHFFDVMTQVAQVMIFFLLGLVVTPVTLPSVVVPALILTLLLTFIVRPAVVALLLLPFRAPLSQILLTSWAGLRGAASIVFAITAILSGINLSFNLFNLIFCMVLLSISIQGTLLPAVAKRLSMIDATADVGKTFTDYTEDTNVTFGKVHVNDSCGWAGKTLLELNLPTDLIVAMILRRGGMVIPTGATKLEPGDTLILGTHDFQGGSWTLEEEIATEGTYPLNTPLAELSLGKNQRILLIRRGPLALIPSGTSVLKEGDILVHLKENEEHSGENA
jgi:cell volume regulation protein A